VDWTGSYHAAGDPSADPPYMRRMLFSTPGMRLDTSVPDKCTATDAELSVNGPDACPPGSKIASGTTDAKFFMPLTHAFVFDQSTHEMQIFNNTNEQILLVKAVGWAVVRGTIHPDNTIDFSSPTCFPSPPAGQPCLDDDLLQLGSTSTMPEYTRTIDGQLRAYATTPPTCPSSGHWETTVTFWWADGATDDVVTMQPCVAPAPS